MPNNEHRYLTWGDLSDLTWSDLANLTWGDLAEPIDVLYERYHDNQLPLTANAADKLRRLIFVLPEKARPVKNPKTNSETVEFMKDLGLSLTRIIAPDIFKAATELIKSLLQ